MSKSLSIQIPDDIPNEQRQSLIAFVENGRPGFHSASEGKISRALEMYLAGNSYYTISHRVALKLPIVLYLSGAYNWPALKRKHLEDLSQTILEKTTIASIEGANLISELVFFWKEYYRSKIEAYHTTKDDRIAESIDLKTFQVLFKSIEILDKLKNTPALTQKQPLMGINVPDGAQIEKINDNTIKVSTPSSESIDNDLKAVLKALADLNRARESDGNINKVTKKEKNE